MHSCCTLRCMLEAILIPSTIGLKMFCLLFCVFEFPHPYTCQGLSSPFFSVLFLICSFWFLLSALLTCFVSFFPLCFLSAIQYLQMKWPLLDVQPGSLQSRQALKDARSPSPAHIVVSNNQHGTFALLPALLPPSFRTERQTNHSFLLSPIL